MDHISRIPLKRGHNGCMANFDAAYAPKILFGVKDPHDGIHRHIVDVFLYDLKWHALTFFRFSAFLRDMFIIFHFPCAVNIRPVRRGFGEALDFLRKL